MKNLLRWAVRLAVVAVAVAVAWPAAHRLAVAEKPMPLPQATWSKAPGAVTPLTSAVVPAATRPATTTPQTVYVPEVGITLPFHDAGQTDGWLDLDSSITSGVHFADGSTLAAGSYLVAAHVNSKDLSLSPFAKLTQVQPGTMVWVTDEHNVAHAFTVTALDAYRKEALPTDIFRPTGASQLVLVTCGGKIVDDGTGRRHYEDNVVVRAVPAKG